MHRHLTTTAVALLVCGAALSGCGEQEPPTQQEPAQEQPTKDTLGYGNYLPRQQQDSPAPVTVGHVTTDHAHVAE